MRRHFAHIHRRWLLRRVKGRLIGRAALRPPRVPIAGNRFQRPHKGIRAGLNAQFRLIHLAKLGLRAMHMDQALIRLRHRQERVAIGRVLAKARIDGEDHIGLRDHLLDRRVHADTRLAAEHRRRVVELILIAEHRHNGDVGTLGKGLQRGAARVGPVAPAVEDQRPFRLRQNRAGLRHGVVRGMRFRIGRGPAQRCRLGFGGQHILGQRDHHRTRAACRRCLPGPRDDLGDAVHLINLHRPFGNRAEHRAVVDFLKRLAALHIRADLPDQNDHRHAVLHRGVNPDGGIRYPRTARDQTDPRCAGELAPGRRHKGRAPLVAAQHVVKTTAGVVHRIQHREIAFPRNPERLARAQGHQTIHQKFSAMRHPEHLHSPNCCHR